ncbi:MAG: hypothetical protein ACKVOK_14715 [Flavobacteriales bacterium]
MKKLIYIAFPILLIACVENNKPSGQGENPKPAANKTNAVDNRTNEIPSANQKGTSTSGGSQSLQAPQATTNGTNLSSASVPRELEDEIKRVLELFGKQDIKVGVNEAPIEATKATKLFVGVYMKNKSKVQSWDDFVNVLSTEPTTSGKPFFVVDKERKQTPLGEYLNQLHKKK